MASSNRFPRLFWRACRLRCPLCGKGKLFRNWIKMHPNCSHCGAKFEREAGFFLGSIYFNYGLTALIVSIFYPLALFNEWLSNDALLGSSLVFCLIFPMWFFRYARSLWLGFDQFVDPRPEEGGFSDEGSSESNSLSS
jgi:uncharacterized protein (DUF983 family)